MTLDNTVEREPSLLDGSCEVFVEDLARLSPTDATAWGIAGYDGELQDFSPEYWEALAERNREMLADVDAFDDSTDSSDDEEDFDEVDHVTAEVLRDRLRIAVEEHRRGEDLALLNNIASPVQEIRDSFLLIPRDGDAVRSRLSKIPAALAGYRESLSEAAANGRVAAHRQINEVVAQCAALAEPGSMLEDLGVDPKSEEVSAARQAFGELGDWLLDQLAPHAPSSDAVGRERYELFSHKFVGDVVDLDEAYEWGLESLREIVDEQQRLAAQLYGEGTSVKEAYRRLDEEPRYLIEGTDALVEWMQATADRAIAELHGTHFDIPESIQTIDCRIDPAGTGGIFYTPPSDDFSRPGAMWWSVPKSQTEFHTWQELTTVFHEGVPGHHLQLGTTIDDADRLNAWRRVACWNSGHGEGWALYAEQLMAELGYLDDPGMRMGYLDAQRLRAARVVLDIGVHLGKPTPEGTGTWDAAYAKSFLRENTAMDEGNFTFELNRYLGWPGQAPSYALGQRAWMDMRVAATSAGVSLKDFHSRALGFGSIPLSVLRTRLIPRD